MPSSSVVATTTMARRRLSSARNTTPTKTPSPRFTDSPTNWTHPDLGEITTRQPKSVFGGNNVRSIVYNLIALVVYLGLRSALLRRVPAHLLPPHMKRYVDAVHLLLLLPPLFPFFNILMASLPLICGPEAVADVALTPGQRRFLRLPQCPTPPAPNSVYTTPPRFSRTPSLAGSPIGGRNSGSPLSLSAKESPVSDRRRNGGTFSPSDRRNSSFSHPTSNPFLHKAIGNIPPRSSFASTTGLGASTASSFLDGPLPPSPLAGKQASVVLTNKFLYERERSRLASSNGSLYY